MRSLLGVLAALVFAAGPQCARAQKNLAGATEAHQALERLTVKGSVLMIAAHPDDENTALLAMLARGRKVRTGYLSLTRGEGGQNLIGSEQGHLLGLIRTQELLAARRIDGAEQFFTRAVDFGFSKTAEETLAKWGHDKILGDVVWVIRKFRPDVIVLRFSGTPRDGHGNHQASAILGKEAFFAAADPSRFPEQLDKVKPWKTKRLMWNAFAFTREQEKEAETLPGRIEVDLGAFNPLLGYSYSEIAGMSRSQHESQGMGSAERRGTIKNYLVHVAGDQAKTDLLDGVQVQWEDPKIAKLLADAASAYEPGHPEKTVALLLQARPLITDERRRSELEETIALCANLWLDATTNNPMAPPGSDVRITAEALNRSAIPVRLESVQIGPLTAGGGSRDLQYNLPVTATVDWKAENISQPPLREQPEQDPILQARFNLRLQGEPLTLIRPVHHRYVDPVRGELTRPFVVVPPLSVKFGEPTLVFPDASPRALAVQLRSWNGRMSGGVSLGLPAGWHTEPAQQTFEFATAGEERTLRFVVTPPAGSATADVKAIATVAGTEMSKGVQIIAYSHIPPITVFPDASASLVRTDVKVLSKRVGYVMGAGDAVPEALRQIGCEVTLLSDEDLARGDLSQFDAVVTGVRAYNTRPALRATQGRLLDYVSRGGTMVIQYNTAERSRSGDKTGALDNLGPYPLEIGRDRITVEDSPVEFLHANHPLLSSPNRITNADFEGWIQERGLYFASKWDPKYETVVSSHDPGEKPLAGGILYTKYGKGTWVFTGYSWFRELPAGVPGAYRIFANLLSAGKTTR